MVGSQTARAALGDARRAVSAATAEGLPPRSLSVGYFGLAHLALALAFAAAAIDPDSAAGFFYHPRMLAFVHLITLGWISASIMGALYIVAPIALRTTLPARWPDYAGASLFWIGITGMVAHFWIAESRGMAWSAGTAVAGLLCIGSRVAAPLCQAPISGAVRLHLALAFLNLAGAAIMGVLLGIHRVHPFLPGPVLGGVFAHAHLAAVGWAAMMVVGVGYRLLPMVLPAQMPTGADLYASAALLQVGAWGIFATLFLGLPAAGLFAAAIVAGLVVFLSRVAWMTRHRRPRPPAIRTPDPAVLHGAAALGSLVIACGLGMWLAFAARSETTLRVAAAYGVFGLVGFLAQMVVAMEGRLLPIFAWYWASANAAGHGPVVSPHAMPWRAGQYAVAGLWLIGVPALAGGLASGAVPLVRAAALCLFAATVLDSAQMAIIVRHAYGRRRTPEWR